MYHLVDGIHVANALPSRELRDIVVQVFGRDAVIRAVEPAFEHRPERLHAVSVCLPTHVFAGAVVDRPMTDAIPGLDPGVRVKSRGD